MEQVETQLDFSFEYLAERMRGYAAELTDACLGSSFVDSDLDGPDDSDYELFDSIIELLIENEIYHYDDEDGPTRGDPEDESIKNASSTSTYIISRRLVGAIVRILRIWAVGGSWYLWR